MKSKGNWFLVAAVLIFGTYAYFGEFKKEAREAQEKEKQNQIISLKKDQIQKILVETAGEKLVMSRSLDGWNLSGPVNDQADNEVLESLLDQMVQEKAVDRISITPAIDLDQYGLLKSLGTLTFLDNKEMKQKITVSSKRNFEGLYFLRVNENPEILTTGEAWFNFLSKPATSFRDLRLFRFPISKVERIEILNREDQFLLEYQEGFWKSKSQPEFELDQNQIREILSQVSLAKGIELLKEISAGAPAMKINLVGDKFQWKADFHKDPKSKDWLVRISEPPMLIRFGPQVLEKVTNLGLLDLRDKTRPFQFDKEAVTAVSWKTNLKNQSIQKVGDQWIVTPDDPKYQVDAGSVTLLLDKIKNLKVYRYLSEPKKPSKLTNLIELKDQQGSVVYSLQWSDFVNHEGYAKSSVSGELFLIDDAQINNLDLHKVLKVKGEAP